VNIPANLDDKIVLGLAQDPESLEYSLARNLVVWREYASELAKGIDRLHKQIQEQAE